MRVLNDVSGPLFAARNYVLAESETYMYLLFILLPRIKGKKKKTRLHSGSTDCENLGWYLCLKEFNLWLMHLLMFYFSFYSFLFFCLCSEIKKSSVKSFSVFHHSDFILAKCPQLSATYIRKHHPMSQKANISQLMGWYISASLVCTRLLYLPQNISLWHSLILLGLKRCFL